MPDLELRLDEPLSDFLQRAFPDVETARMKQICIDPFEISVTWLQKVRPRVITTSRRRIRVRLPDFPASPTPPTEKEND